MIQYTTDLERDMKIQINYDLLDEIDYSKKGFHLDKTLSKNFKKSLFWFGVYCAWDIGKPFLECLPGNIMSATIFFTLINTFDITFYNKPRVREEREFDAYDNLKRLAVYLNTLQVKTNATLLQDGQLLEKHYKVVEGEKGFPRILEEKYIEIPTCNNYGHESTEVLLQEHLIGSRKYDISVGETPRQKRLQFAKGTI